MNQNPRDKQTRPDDAANKEDTALERAAKKIVPPSHNVTTDDLKDPGRMTPNAPPTDNRS